MIILAYTKWYKLQENNSDPKKESAKITISLSLPLETLKLRSNSLSKSSHSPSLNSKTRNQFLQSAMNSLKSSFQFLPIRELPQPLKVQPLISRTTKLLWSNSLKSMQPCAPQISESCIMGKSLLKLPVANFQQLSSAACLTTRPIWPISSTVMILLSMLLPTTMDMKISLEACQLFLKKSRISWSSISKGQSSDSTMLNFTERPFRKYYWEMEKIKEWVWKNQDTRLQLNKSCNQQRSTETLMWMWGSEETREGKCFIFDFDL